MRTQEPHKSLKFTPVLVFQVRKSGHKKIESMYFESKIDNFAIAALVGHASLPRKGAFFLPLARGVSHSGALLYKSQLRYEILEYLIKETNS